MNGENMKQGEIQQAFASMQAKFAAQLAERVIAIHDVWRECQAGQWQEAEQGKLHRLVHSLVGTAGTFSAMRVSNVARELEQVIVRLRDRHDVPDQEFCNRIDALIEGLDREARSWQPSGLARLKELPTIENIFRDHRKIYLVEDDSLFAEEMMRHLADGDYEIQHFHDVKSFADQCQKELPALVIMDMMFEEGEYLGAEILQSLKQSFPAFPPVVFVTVRGDVAARLAAARAGAQRYFVKPLDYPRLRKTVDGLTERTPRNPYRVLIVDDEVATSEYYRVLLERAGIEVECLADPMQLLAVMHRFQPELVLMDVYMPVCTGYELASVIRQDDEFSQIGLIFLSSEGDLDRQLEAMHLGGDQFLTKPVSPDYLVQSVIVRLKRLRRVRLLNDELQLALRETQFHEVALDQHAIVSVTDVDGVITEANDRFCAISGYPKHELIGKNHRVINSGYHSKSFMKDMWDTITAGRVWRGEICNRAKDGHLYWVDATIVPFVDKDGRPYKYVSIRTDITRLKQTESSLRESEERFKWSQEFANIGTWDWEINTGRLYWSDRIAFLFGYHDAIPETTYDKFLAALHPGDRRRVIDAVMACVEQGDEYNIEHRVVWQDGTVRWLHESGDVVRDGTGAPLHMLGVVQDITHRKALESSLERQQHLLSLLQVGLTQFVTEAEFRVVADHLLTGLLELTESEYGFTGEILRDEQGQLYLKTHAVTNIAWNEEMQRFYDEFAPKGMEFRNLNTLFGAVMTSGKVVYVNNAGTDSRRGGLPDGHPALNTFLGVPIYYGEELVGMYGLANHPEGYDENLVEFLQPFNATYGVIIHARRALARDRESRSGLIAAKEEAESANRAKSQFLSRMSHELRTPMNAILGFSQLLELDAPLSESQKDSVDEIIGAGKHLLVLIDEVLDLARIEAGRIDLSIETVVLEEVIDECISLLEPFAAEHHVTMRKEVPGDTLVARADRIRLKQVLLNFLSNAIKYNRDSGTVVVRAMPGADQHVRIEVEDTGMGIPDERKSELFGAFNRLGAEYSDVEGTGIGLVISKNLVELMGGRIGAESQQGQGSIFWLELIQDQLSAVTYSEGERAASLERNTLEEEYSVLYIEDNPANLRLVTQVLAHRANIHLLTAHDAEIGLYLARHRLPELILLDINLPGMDGFEVLRRLRAEATTHHIPVVAITANATASDVEKGRLAGFESYLTKPIDINILLQTVDSLLLRELRPLNH